MKMRKRLTACALAVCLCAAVPAQGFAAEATRDWTLKTAGFENGSAVNLDKIGSYVTGTSNLDGGVAEIISYDSVNNKAWVVNGATGMLDILDLSGVTGAVSEEMTAESLDIKALVEAAAEDFVYGDMTSVAVNSEKGIAAVALQAKDYDKNGKVAILSTGGSLLALIDAGCQPDMVTFTPDGTKILVANESEPREGYGEGVTDPAGSVTIVEVNYEELKDSAAVNVGFEYFDAYREELAAEGIMMTKGQLPSEDFEPEYIACDDERAYVTLQEANAVAVLNLENGQYEGVYSLGYKDLGDEANAIDLIEDGVYETKTYSDTVSAYMPDGISLYRVDGKTYILTANEGDAREWGSDETEFCNEIKEKLTADDGTEAKKVRAIDPEVTDGLPEGKNVMYGGRSFSIYQVTEEGLTQVYDSANDFEEMTAAYIPDFFNCSNDDNDFDSRSPKKGIEPESVTVGTVDDKTYAFIALERVGGIMMYDITDPANVTYENYINTRDFAEEPSEADPEENPGFSLKSDIAPEGLYFISDAASPSGTPILMAAFEVSGTVAAYGVGEVPQINDENDDADVNDDADINDDADVNDDDDVNDDSDINDGADADVDDDVNGDTAANDEAGITDDEAEGTADDEEEQAVADTDAADEDTADENTADENMANENATHDQAADAEELPETGDEGMVGLWAAVMAACCVVVAVLRKGLNEK